MFVDASAIVAVLGREQGYELVAYKISEAARRYVSPLVIWEATLALVRTHAMPFEKAEIAVDAFVEEMKASIVSIDAKIGREARGASLKYGKGRHRAGLNFGDCFAYACAKVYRLPLLYVGDDFTKTDLA
jgi:ribonuclease VapC